jgi:hypothetical protein
MTDNKDLLKELSDQLQEADDYLNGLKETNVSQMNYYVNIN